MAATNFILVDPAAGAAQNAADSSLTETGGSILVNTNKVTIATATGNTAIAGTLAVTGAATLASTLGVTGNVAVATNKFTVAAATGNTVVAGTLATTGASTFASTVAITGSTTIDGALFLPITAVAAATYNQLLTDSILSVTYTATGACTIDLKTAQTTNGRVIVIKDAGGLAATNNITITTEGSQLIDGAATKVINTNYGSVTLYCNGSNWYSI